MDWSGTAGHVFVHGERWAARSPEPLNEGQSVRVLRLDGLTLVVSADAPQAPKHSRRIKEPETMSVDINFAFMIVIALVALYIVSQAIRIFREYERGVVFTLGRYTKTIGPGLTFVIPIIQQVVRVDLRMKVQDVPTQDVISRDNVSVKVNAVLYFRVVDPARSTINIEDYMEATSQLAQTTLRSVLGKHELDEMLAEREKLNADIQEILDQQTDSWGIKVANVEIKHVDIDESMVRAIAMQAEAERFRRAKIINAEGEQQAAQKLIEAGKILAEQPNAMILRYFGALHDVAGNRTSTIVFPIPMDLAVGLKS